MAASPHTLQNLVQNGKRPAKKRFVKTKKIVLGIIALEILAILVLSLSPLGQQARAKAENYFKQTLEVSRVVSLDLPDDPDQKGFSYLLLASNGPFSIVADGPPSEYHVTLYKSGQINGKTFGDLVEFPTHLTGPQAQSCAKSLTDSPQQILKIDHATAPRQGQILHQAILVEIRHSNNIDPIFSAYAPFQPQYKTTQSAQDCPEQT